MRCDRDTVKQKKALKQEKNNSPYGYGFMFWTLQKKEQHTE